MDPFSAVPGDGTAAAITVATKGRLLTSRAFKHLGLAEPSRDSSQFGLFGQDDDE